MIGLERRSADALVLHSDADGEARRLARVVERIGDTADHVDRLDFLSEEARRAATNGLVKVSRGLTRGVPPASRYERRT